MYQGIKLVYITSDAFWDQYRCSLGALWVHFFKKTAPTKSIVATVVFYILVQLVQFFWNSFEFFYMPCGGRREDTLSKRLKITEATDINDTTSTFLVILNAVKHPVIAGPDVGMKDLRRTSDKTHRAEDPTMEILHTYGRACDARPLNGVQDDKLGGY